MASSDLRSRVERLLKGDFRPDDLTRLFLYARDRCDGRESVQEVGDFVAHRDQRSKGIITRTARDFYTILRFKIPNLGQAIDGANLPSDFPEFLTAVLRSLDAKLIKRDTGLSLASARKLLPVIVGKIIHKPDGTIALPPTLSSREVALVTCLSQFIVAKPAFDGDRLFEDFAATLRSHGLLQHSELQQFRSLKAGIVLYAVTVMHQCKVQLGDGTMASLKAHGGVAPNSRIGVLATVSVPLPGKSGRLVQIASDMFTTDLDTQANCEEELQNGEWDA
jgi:hypothetical protein